MNNKFLLIMMILVLGGIVGFSIYSKQPHVCNDLHYQQKIAPPGPPDNRQSKERPPFVNGKVYNYSEGLDLCKKTKTTMFVVFGAEWCTWCKKLEKTLAAPEITALTDKCIKVHVDSDTEKDIVAKLKMGGKGIPVYCIVDENERILKEGSGYKTIQAFRQWWGQAADGN